MLFCRFPAVFAGFRRFTLVLYCSQQKTEKSGEVAFFGGKLPVMAMGKTKEVQGDEEVVETRQKGKVGRPRIPVSEADQKKAIEACRLGIPLERVAILCGFPSGNAGRWHDFLKRNPDFADLLEKARLEGELELTSVVRQCGNGWQGSAWLLERTRGYVARASLEHTGKGGKELSISGNLLGAFGGGNK
jgi:hypothetical protein